MNGTSDNLVRAIKGFPETNGVVAKMAFLILVLIMFVTALRMGSMLLASLFEPSRNPILIKGMIDSKERCVFPQNPSVNGAVPIMRSTNDDDGMEFTWSVWIYINDFHYKRDEYKHVFHKGNDDINLTETDPKFGMNEPNNAPGLYITPHTNDLLVVMNSFEKINDEVIIKGVPLKKWINVIIRLNKQNQLDVYINGTLTKRHFLHGVAKQNYGDVFVSMNRGFDGNTSELRYFDTAIGMNKIRNIVDKGPNLKMNNSSNIAKSKPYYLSSQWYFNEVSR
jgi:hypothetical protein